MMPPLISASFSRLSAVHRQYSFKYIWGGDHGLDVLPDNLRDTLWLHHRDPVGSFSNQQTLAENREETPDGSASEAHSGIQLRSLRVLFLKVTLTKRTA
jgi:hypothetical protein